MNTATVGSGKEVHYVTNGRTLCGAGRNSKIGSRGYGASLSAALLPVDAPCTCRRCLKLASAKTEQAGEEVPSIVVPLAHPATDSKVRSICRRQGAPVEFSETLATIRPATAAQRERLLADLAFQRIDVAQPD